MDLFMNDINEQEFVEAKAIEIVADDAEEMEEAGDEDEDDELQFIDTLGQQESVGIESKSVPTSTLNLNRVLCRSRCILNDNYDTDVFPSLFRSAMEQADAIASKAPVPREIAISAPTIAETTAAAQDSSTADPYIYENYHESGHHNIAGIDGWRGRITGNSLPKLLTEAEASISMSFSFTISYFHVSSSPSKLNVFS